MSHDSHRAERAQGQRIQREMPGTACKFQNALLLSKPEIINFRPLKKYQHSYRVPHLEEDCGLHHIGRGNYVHAVTACGPDDRH
jgi:hypothetical protein